MDLGSICNSKLVYFCFEFVRLSHIGIGGIEDRRVEGIGPAPSARKESNNCRKPMESFILVHLCWLWVLYVFIGLWRVLYVFIGLCRVLFLHFRAS